MLRKIDANTASKWSVSVDEAKYNFISRIIDTQHPPGSEHGKRFLNYLRSKEYYRHSAHFLRYHCTFKEMCEITDAVAGGKTVVETGGASPISDFLSAENECYATEGDLRDRIDCADNFADVLLSFEVLEHIKDKPEKEFKEVVLFQQSGAKQYVREMERILKPGGYLFLTTPNPCGLFPLRRLLRGEAPMVFRPHVREYSKAEVLDFFQLDLVSYCTMYNFANLHDGPELAQQMFAQLNASPEERGDDHLFCFRKAVR